MLTQQKTQPNYALAAGLAYIGIIAFGIFAELFVRQSLHIWGDTNQTITNIQENMTLFKLGYLADLTMFIFDAALAFFLFKLFNPISKNWSLFILILNIIRIPVMAMNSLNHYSVIQYLNPENHLSAFNQEQLNSLAKLALETHSIGYTMNSIFFAAWCVAIGYLIITSNIVPKFIGFMMLIDAISFITTIVIQTLAPAYMTSLPVTIITSIAVGELILCLYLLIMSKSIHKKWLTI